MCLLTICLSPSRLIFSLLDSWSRPLVFSDPHTLIREPKSFLPSLFDEPTIYPQEKKGRGANAYWYLSNHKASLSVNRVRNQYWFSVGKNYTEWRATWLWKVSSKQFVAFNFFCESQESFSVFGESLAWSALTFSEFLQGSINSVRHQL